MENNVAIEEKGPFAPDTLLPEQFFGQLRHRAQMDGERRLMLAVLEDGIHCFRKYAGIDDPRARELFREAESWILEEDRTWFFSFENVCDTLELDPEYVRAGLVRWKKRTLAGVSGSEDATDSALKKASGA